MPKVKGIIPYKTTHGIVAHYYGAQFALGGMFAIKGIDFEKTGGFPNFWGWGLEDNAIQNRCIKVGLTIDRSIFFHMSDKSKIYRSNDGTIRTVSKRDGIVYKFENPDNVNDLKNLNWTINNEMINIYSFEATMKHDDQDYYKYDIRKGPRIKIKQGYFRRNWNFNYIIKK